MEIIKEMKRILFDSSLMLSILFHKRLKVYYINKCISYKSLCLSEVIKFNLSTIIDCESSKLETQKGLVFNKSYSS